ncbi:hypothetical protein [Streptomyces sp. NPDC053560]|uniref:hypothetical protein n=1 Tax=Streptomyces sp. NPDC053560 TaxID=3365711 RepID=UPI0037D3BF6C
MNHKHVRTAAAAIVAAITVGVAAPAATAATSPQTRLAAAQEAQLPSTFKAFLDSDDPEVRAFLSVFTPEELAEMQQVADGHDGAAAHSAKALKAPNWGKIWGALKKIGGFAKAVGGKYNDFKKWVDSRPWYVKYLIKSVTPGLSLYDIWWHFNH